MMVAMGQRSHYRDTLRQKPIVVKSAESAVVVQFGPLGSFEGVIPKAGAVQPAEGSRAGTF